MNIRILENYMEYCKDEQEQPTFEGLKAYNYNDELINRIIRHVRANKTNYKYSQIEKLISLLTNNYIELTTVQVLSGTIKENDYIDYLRNNEIVLDNLMDLLYN